MTSLNLRVKRHHLAVDTRTAAPMTEFSMHLIGKIDGGRPFLKFDYAPLRRQRINMVIFKAWFGRRRYVALPIQQLTQPGNALLFGFGSLVLVRIAGFLITPMRSHTKFGKLMHRACTDLNFHRTS